MALTARPRILCVDDEPSVLELLSRVLASRYEVMTAVSGELGLKALADRGQDTAVIISDMHMPEMDGARFLARTRHFAPDAIRMLLTGYADVDSAIAAINDGQIFRFLNKPCAPTVLLSAVEAAVRQHQLVTSERVLLEQTLHGSIQALADVLALSNPAVFGRALRLKSLVSELAIKLEASDRWQIEVAAMLSQIACVALPAETLQRFYLGQRLSDQEVTMVGRLPAHTEKMLANIPRLESIRAILASSGVLAPGAVPPPIVESLRRAAMIVRVAADFDSLDLQGVDALLAVNLMRSKRGLYEKEVVDALESLRALNRLQESVSEIPWSDLLIGMVIAKDLYADNGMLVVARGYLVTSSFVERARNFPPSLKRTVSVVVSDRGPRALSARSRLL